MAIDVWRPNTVLNLVSLPLIPIWVQLWGLPLKYQSTDTARRLTQIISLIALVDWEDVMPRNLQFMRVQVWLDPKEPLIMGCMLK